MNPNGATSHEMKEVKRIIDTRFNREQMQKLVSEINKDYLLNEQQEMNIFQIAKFLKSTKKLNKYNYKDFLEYLTLQFQEKI
ncbi:hypothetical protein A3K64_00040 [Candidatus Micrarchaeota archaeon RBG_16_36_9]|nr:MAG: hypothetical protein A3K64_00040 [Candidatus Micrarchaeota archaeon RBG_16_36_9]